jgi:Ino eighty subunit 1
MLIVARTPPQVAFLVNVGKINTTAAFYPEMKTLIRHFHSIPSIQKTEMSKALLQDSPRLKACLRGVELPSDEGSPPYTLAEVEAKTVRTSPTFQPFLRSIT